MPKLKAGRFWFIRCKYPIPRGDGDFWISKKGAKEALQGKLLTTPWSGSGPAITLPPSRPMKQPLYDTKELTPDRSGEIKFFHTSGVPGKWGYYWSDGRQIVWGYAPRKATRFDTREDAEAKALELAALAPWLIGHLEVVKIKLEREE